MPRKRPAGEAEFLAAYDPTAYAPTAVTVDLALLTIRDGRLVILLVRRGGHPYKGTWALPGGFVEPDETLDDAARRELAEETSVAIDAAHIEQLRSYGDPGRDPRMRVVSVAYLAFLPITAQPAGGSDAAAAEFVDVADILTGSEAVAFDHAHIISDAVERCRSKLEYTTLATAFLPDTFTLGDLRRIYEAVWATPLHESNFARKALSIPGFVAPVDDVAAGKRVRYRRGDATTVTPPIMRPTAGATP